MSVRRGSTRVELYFRESVDAAVYVRTDEIVRVVRLVGGASFRAQHGWSAPEPAFIDTGSPVSLLPKASWTAVQYSLIDADEYEIRVAGTATSGKLAWVTLRVQDAVNTSPPLLAKAYLLPDDAHPLLLGYEDVLTNAALYSDFARREVYLEFAAP